MGVNQKIIIRTVGGNQHDIIKDILRLHAENGNIDVDCTYSKGNFYKHGIKRPTHCFDIEPQYKYVQKADAKDLPLPDESQKVLMFDPPFLSRGGGLVEGKTGKVGERFGTFGKDMIELWSWYKECLVEFERVLVPNGIVIFKCQDAVSSQTQYFSHCAIMDFALRAGFYPLDLFILVANSRPIKQSRQVHARKYHSYFWVFKKKYCKVDYPILLEDV